MEPTTAEGWKMALGLAMFLFSAGLMGWMLAWAKYSPKRKRS